METNSVETSLARALDLASAAKQWDVVAAVVRELEARRLAASPNVIPIATRSRRGGR